MASLYPTQEAMSPPVPGMAPISVPIRLDRISVGKMVTRSLLEGSTRSSLVFTLARVVPKLSCTLIRPWERANRPISTGMLEMPPVR